MEFLKMRKTFCECPECKTIYRLSDSDVFDDVAPKLDILDTIEKELIQLEAKEAILKEKLLKVKYDATITGRIDADNHISNIDPIFNPIGLNPNDAKVHFHPVDFVVFNGMNDINNSKIKNIIFLDSAKNSGELQESIRRCIENEQYEFITIKIQNDGSVIKE